MLNKKRTILTIMCAAILSAAAMFSGCGTAVPPDGNDKLKPFLILQGG